MQLNWRERAQLECWANDHLYSRNLDFPENWPEVSRFGAGGEPPLYCGDHAIGLTAVYSVVNAIKLLVAETTPLQPSEERYCLEQGWRFLSGRVAMTPDKGLRVHLVSRLAEAMSFAFGRRRQISVRCDPIDPPLSVEPTRDFLERCVVARRVVLILLGGAHYTVLRGYTSGSWLVFDATGRHWMQRLRGQSHRKFVPFLIMHCSK